MLHNVIKEIKPNNAKCYQGNQTKRYLMLSWKSKQTMQNVIMDIKPNDACYQGNQTKRCIMLSRKSNQTMHNVIKETKPNDAYVIREIKPNHEKIYLRDHNK